MISYSTNWMGPVNMNWFRERGLTEKRTRIVEENSILVKIGRKQVGDVLEYDEITTHYSAGRIDIRDDSKEGYDGWNEYGLSPMRTEDWNALSDYLDTLETKELLSYDELIEQFETHYGQKIRWAE